MELHKDVKEYYKYSPYAQDLNRKREYDEGRNVKKKVFKDPNGTPGVSMYSFKFFYLFIVAMTLNMRCTLLTNFEDHNHGK